MKRTNSENCFVSEIIGKELSIQFSNQEFKLSKWGEVDNYYEASARTYILLECENKQKHPNTNVLKLFPYLEENPRVTAVLIQYFYPENKAPQNRLALCEFIGSRIEKEFPDRFQYIILKGQLDEIADQLGKNRKGLLETLLNQTLVNKR